MIVVSYTRVVSAIEEPLSIREQNEHIAEYIKKKGWKLSKKYSDRKDDLEADDGFVQMKKDGIDRQYDCLVLQSMHRCGKNTTYAYDLFFYIYLAAGIQFAVIDDQFFSGEHTVAEIEAYLKKKRLEYRYARQEEGRTKKLKKRKYPKYGYCYEGDGTKLLVDPEAAEVVREAFALAADGKLYREIAEIFNARGLMEPTDYYRVMQGKEALGKKWKKERVGSILHNKLYVGEWERTFGGVTTVLACPALVEREVYDKATLLCKNRRVHDGARVGHYNAFTKRIYDKDTAATLRMYIHPKLQVRIFRFGYPKSHDVSYRKYYLEYDIVEKEVKRQLLEEKKKADKALGLIESEHGKQAKKRRREDYIEHMRSIVQKQMEAESRRIALVFREKECEEEEADLLTDIENMDRRIKVLMEKIQEEDVIFSKNNPWIKTFSALSLQETLTQENVKQCIEKIEVEKFEQVRVIFKHRIYFHSLPARWFEEE